MALLVAAGAPGGEPAKGTVVELDKLKSVTPADWKSEKPANRLRSYQFRLPRAKTDDDDAELAILDDAQPPADQSLQRWKESFQPPEGKTLDDVATVTTFKVGPATVTYLDVHGTYMQLPRPQASKKEAKARPNFRMLAIFFATPDGAHSIRLVGPYATVEQHKAAFDGWLKGFK